MRLWAASAVVVQLRVRRRAIRRRILWVRSTPATVAAPAPRLQRQTASQRLARSPRPEAQRRDPPLKSNFGLREPGQKLLEGIPSEIPKIHLEHAGPPHGAPGHDAIQIEALQRLLNAG